MKWLALVVWVVALWGCVTAHHLHGRAVIVQLAAAEAEMAKEEKRHFLQY